MATTVHSKGGGNIQQKALPVNGVRPPRVRLAIVMVGAIEPATAVAWQTNADRGRVWSAATLLLAPF